MDKFELNHARRVNMPEMNSNTKRQFVEVCNSLIFNRPMSSELNSLKDKMATYLKEKGAAAADGDMNAISEVNAVVTLVVEPAILQATELYGLMGNYHELAYNETAEVETWKLEGGDARMQAYNGDVGFGTWKWDKYAINTKTISAGAAVDYRELAMGNFDSKLPQQIQHLTTDMNNKAMAYIMDSVFEALKNNTKYVKFYSEYTGTITAAVVDALINKIWPLGKVSIIGDRSVLSTISGWQGYQVVSTGSSASAAVPFNSPAMADAMMNNGMLTMYKGSNLVEMPNPYNLTKPLADKSAFETYYSAKRTLFMPTGINSPVNIFRRGGVTTMTGSDVKTGRYLTRYDMEIGVDVVRGEEYKIGAAVKTD